MPAWTRVVLAPLLLAFVLHPGLTLLAESSDSLHPLCLVTANGWTLAIKSDGSATLFRTQKIQLRSQAPPGAFPYKELVKAIKEEAKASPHPQPSSISYYFAEFDPAATTEIEPIPKIRETLSVAQSTFLSSVSPLIRQLLNQYPLIGMSRSDE